MRGVALGLALFAGLAAAYVQALAGYWLEGLWGMPRLDLAEAGKRYLGGERPGWWLVGMVAHLFNGALLGLLYAATVYAWAGGDGALLRRLVLGVAYGVAVWVVVFNLMLLPLGGAGAFGRHGVGVGLRRTSLLLHVLYGLTLGAIYDPA